MVGLDAGPAALGRPAATATERGGRLSRLLMIAHSNAPWSPHYARYFASRGYELLVVTFAPDPIDGVATEFVGVQPFDKYKNKHLFLTRIPRIRRIIRDFRPHLIYAPYIISNGLTAVLSWRGPVVAAARGSDVLTHWGWRGRRRWVRERIIRFVCRRAAAVHTVSEEIDAELLRLRVAAAKLHRIPLGVDVERFRPSGDAPRAIARRIVCTRKHEPVYDMPTIIRALARLKQDGADFACRLIGGGHLLKDHRALAAELGADDRIEMTGHRPHEALADELRAADVYVSASWSDGTSSSLLEALAAGVFPVVTRIPANRAWVVEGETGLMFEPGDADELASQLRRAVGDAELRRRAFERNRERIARDGHMMKNMQRLEALFHEVLTGTGGTVGGA